ncbi:META domain-containing protein [Hymenobacter terrestris]|uniref:META domain-containing protein n=1 Tax=Hymenobacter terrestris TaxID=2748310 RepID=A0ABX2PXT0_9BACT|nr:META domain-containing protein [Hymenobacter terrestris]NVO83498.1 META domain-containing protein [Hymenobacter terrestris]
MKTPRRLPVVLLALMLPTSLLLGSCSKDNEPMPAPLYLLDQSWQLIEAEGIPVVTTAGGVATSLTLSSVDNFSAGQAWCNQYGGTFMLVPGTSYLTFSGQASTRATCAEQQQETRYLNLLPEVRRYTITQRQLQLFDSERPQPLLVFEVK